jgi:nucleolar MIF4G domain-containing protein 1
MIETLTNLKNNKLKKAIGGGAGGSGGQEAVERLKKFLAAMSKKRQGRSADIFHSSILSSHKNSYVT